MRFFKKSSFFLAFVSEYSSVRGQIQTHSDIPCDVRIQGASSESNCHYGQWDSEYTSRSQDQKDRAWDSKPGETCGVMDPTLRPGTSMSRSSLHVFQTQLMEQLEKQVFSRKPLEKKNISKRKWADLTEKEKEEIKKRQEKRKQKREEAKERMKKKLQELEDKNEAEDEDKKRKFMDFLKYQLETVQYRELEEEQNFKNFENGVEPNEEEIKSRKKRLTIDDHMHDNHAYDGTFDGAFFYNAADGRDVFYTPGPSPAIENTHDSATPWVGKFVPCYEEYSTTNPTTCHHEVHARDGLASISCISCISCKTEKSGKIFEILRVFAIFYRVCILCGPKSAKCYHAFLTLNRHWSMPTMQVTLILL